MMHGRLTMVVQAWALSAICVEVCFGWNVEVEE